MASLNFKEKLSLILAPLKSLSQYNRTDQFLNLFVFNFNFVDDLPLYLKCHSSTGAFQTFC